MCGWLQLTYDLYKPYFNKNATSKELLLVSRISVAFFGLIMAVVSVIFYKVRGAFGLLSFGPFRSPLQLCMVVHVRSSLLLQILEV